MSFGQSANLKRQRVLAINDLSGHSHTSLMAILPILNAYGISVTALPTAVLSSNTEQEGFYLTDMTPHMPRFIRQWENLNLGFDAIYSGFLCSSKQIRIVLDAIGRFKAPNAIVIVDPVMADAGELYPCFDQTMIKSFQTLIKHADVITPNLTEAAFLLGETCRQSISVPEIGKWCRKLAEYGPNRIVITSVPDRSKQLITSVACYDKNRDKFHLKSCKLLPVQYPGTGDIFTSILTALLLKGEDLFSATDECVEFIYQAIQLSIKLQVPDREGIALEQALKCLPRNWQKDRSGE